MLSLMSHMVPRVCLIRKKIFLSLIIQVGPLHNQGIYFFLSSIYESNFIGFPPKNPADSNILLN